MEVQGNNIRWLGHAGFSINNKIMIDPFQIAVPIKVDLILITHPHYDHCSMEDIDKIVKEDTTIIATPDCISTLTRFNKGHLKIIEPGQVMDIGDIKVEAVPAYNISKPFHPKQNGWCGYILTVNNQKIYHAGDTDLIPEMNYFQADVALLPVGGQYTMNAEEAAEAARRVKAKYVFPCHYGTIVGTKANAEKLKQLLPDKEVIIQ